MGAGLFHTLNVGSEALFANRQGVDTASHNIANAQVEGFSRQRVNLSARQPSLTRGVLIGNGTMIQDITRAHDQHLEKQINRSNQLMGNLSARRDSLKGIEGIFSPELAASVTDEMGNFFSAVQSLSSSPEDLPVRTALRETAKNLGSSFKRVDEALRVNRQDIDARIYQEIQTVNDALTGIANLNVQIVDSEVTPGSQANDLRDQRDLLLRTLTSKLDINYFYDKEGALAIKGPNQVTLVDRGFAATLHGRGNTLNEGLADIVVANWEGQHNIDVTSHNEGGTLSGLIYVRDKIIPGTILQNNQMADTLAKSVNEFHRDGFGLGEFSEQKGRNFFAESVDLDRAARDFNISDDILESVDAISIASSAMAPGDNVLGNEISRLKNAKIMDRGRASLTDFYANYVGELGLEIQRSDHLAQAQGIVVADLNAQREAVSGVSLDEEAVSLLKWQTAFRASSKVITTVDEMLDTVLNLKR